MRFSRSWLRALALALAFFPPALLPGPVMAQDDAVVAAIGYGAIPRSTLQAYRAAFAPGVPAEAALRRLIDDRLLAIEARRYALAPKPDELAGLRADHPRPAGFAEPEWDQLLYDRALASRFLNFRFGDLGGMLRPGEREQREQAFREELRDRAAVRMVREALPPD